MENETGKKRTQRIVREIMFNLGYDNVREFAETIDANYMQVYYSYVGKVNQLSNDLIEKILTRFTNIRREFLTTGEKPIFNDDSDSIDEPPTETSQFDYTNMLERMITLFEKVQRQSEMIEQREIRIIELENKLLDVVEKLENK